MKKNTMMMLSAAAMLAAGGSAYAADYSRYSNEELRGMRETMRTASSEERSDYRSEWQKRTGRMGKESRRCAPGTRVKEALGLDDAQQKKLQGLRQKQFAEASKERAQLRSLQQEIRNESLKKNPDNRKIAMLSRKIGDTHAELALRRSSHLREMASVLTPLQMEKMKTFMQNRAGRKHGGMML